MRFGAASPSADVRRASGTWTRRARRRHASTGRGSSSPRPACSRCRSSPTSPGRDDFRGEQHHTGRGRRRRSTSRASASRSSAPDRAACSSSRRSRTRSRRSPCTSAPPTGARRSTTRRSPPRSRRSSGPTSRRSARRSNTSVAGFLHAPARPRDVRRLRGGAARVLRDRCGAAPASRSSSSNYTDLLFDPAANAEWCEFIAEKVRGIVDDPETAAQLIPTDHRFGEKRPPFVTGYYETYNQPERLARRPRGRRRSCA